jgi:hypothetical protein
MASSKVWVKEETAGVERFFGSQKHDWIFKIEQLTREYMTKDGAAYIDIITLKGCTLRTVINHLLTMRVLWRKCPIRADQNTFRFERLEFSFRISKDLNLIKIVNE